MLRPTIWLRIAAALTLVHAIAHTIGGVLSRPLPGVATTVARTMQENRFEVFGVMRSYADFNLGLGLAVTIFLAAGAVIFWQLGTVALDHGALVRPIVVSLAIAYAAFAIVSYRYFFWGPVLIESLIALSLVFALLGKQKEV